jgi:glycosyltransferase involved in cell wall biosynthesis
MGQPDWAIWLLRAFSVGRAKSMAWAMISESGNPHGSSTGSDVLVLHVVPSAVARGAQVYARALVDELDGPAARHRLLSLFSGESGVAVDLDLGLPGPATGLDPRVLIRLRRLCRRMRPAVVVAHGGDSLKYLALSGVWSPIVSVAIGTVTAEVHRPVRRALWRFLVGRSAIVVAVSEDVMQECGALLSVPGSKMLVIPNGRDSAQYRPGEHSDQRDDPLLLFVGRLTEGKRPGVFLDLVRSLRERDGNFRAAVIGDGPLRDRLEDSALAADARLLGERPDVPDLMRSAYVLVFTSLPEGEGMPGVLIEAGLSGLPVLATSVPGVRDVVEDGVTGWVLDPEDHQGMVDRAFELLSDPTRRDSMGAAARQRCVDMFSLESSTQKWVDLLDRLRAAWGRYC